MTLTPPQQNRILFLGLLATIVTMGALSFSSSASGQDDPFAATAPGAGGVEGVDGSAGEIKPPPPISSALRADVKVILKAIQESNPQSAIELARSLTTILDLQLPDHARYYIERLEQLKLDDARAFELYESMGSNFFLDLHSDESVQPEGKAFAKKILKSTQKMATSPERLQRLISKLNDSDASASRESIRTLRQLGPIATAEILSVFTNANRKQEFPGLRQALKLMGDDAVPVLLGGARASNLQVQAESVRALANYQSQEALDTMMRTYLSPKVPESLRRVALDALMVNQGTPADPNIVEERFYRQANDFLLGNRKLNQGLLGEVTNWQWDREKSRLVPIVIPTEIAVRMSAAQMASDLYEIRPELPRNRAMFLLTDLESRKRLSGPGVSIESEAVQKVTGDLVPAEIEQVLVEALRLQLIPAATACCELLGQIGTAELVASSSQKPRPLIEALMLGDRHLQFAALEAIAKLDPQTAYAGSSYALTLAVYLAGSQGQGAGLVGDNRLEIAQSYASQMPLAGLAGVACNTGQELFNLARQNPDLELIVITDSLHRPDYFELIQQLRKDMRTRRMPIAILVRDSTSNMRMQRMILDDPLLISLPMTLEPEHIALQARRLQAKISPWKVETLDRQRQALATAQWLQKIASDRTRYRFYDLGSVHKELARIVYLPGLAQPGSSILQHLGTPSAQRELLNFVSQSSFPIEARRAAAEAFTDSLKSRGSMLTREEVLRQYDRYNASANEPVETQELLSSILDALESKAGLTRNR